MSDVMNAIDKELGLLAVLQVEKFTSSLEGRMEVIRQLEHSRLVTVCWLKAVKGFLNGSNEDAERKMEYLYKEASTELIKSRRVSFEKVAPELNDPTLF